MYSRKYRLFHFRNSQYSLRTHPISPHGWMELECCELWSLPFLHSLRLRSGGTGRLADGTRRCTSTASQEARLKLEARVGSHPHPHTQALPQTTGSATASSKMPGCRRVGQLVDVGWAGWALGAGSKCVPTNARSSALSILGISMDTLTCKLPNSLGTPCTGMPSSRSVITCGQSGDRSGAAWRARSASCF